MGANEKLPMLELGKGKPTMLNLSVANEILKTVNGIRAMDILPAGSGRVIISDSKITIMLNKGGQPFGPVNPYTMGSTGGGSTTGGGSGDPPNPDFSVARTDTWERGRPTFDIADVITDGVTFEPIRVWVSPTILYKYMTQDGGGTVQIGYRVRGFYQRQFIFDSDGLYRILGEQPIMGSAGSSDIEIVSIA